MAARSLLTRSLVALPLAGALAFGTVSSASAAWSVKVTDGTGAKGQVCKTRPVGGTVTVRYRLDNRRGSELRLGGFYLVKHGEPWFGAGSVTTKARKGAVSKVIRKRCRAGAWVKVHVYLGSEFSPSAMRTVALRRIPRCGA